MKVLILGADGYIGYALSLHLLKLGHEVIGVDNYVRRDRVVQVGSSSLTPIFHIRERRQYLESVGNYYGTFYISLGDGNVSMLVDFLSQCEPDAIVHLAEQPSAPWSMIDPWKASITQHENVIGTLHLLWAMKQECPNAHLVKLGTMGEYGTPNCDIPEGMVPEECINGSTTRIQSKEDKFFEVTCADGDYFNCPMSGLIFPRQPGSFYHLSKVHDTYNIDFACRNWGLRSTDIMQGVVFGLNNPTVEEEYTRFDYDEYFGTAINRFCAQAIIEHPLTVYGKGEQTRGFLPLKDSIQCLTIALDNPPKEGEYRTFNQFENIYSINDLASIVQAAANAHGLNVTIDHLPNPRKELEEHYYNPAHQKLFDLGYVPTTDIDKEIYDLVNQLIPFSPRVRKDVIMPKTNWR